jgi:hypothetical protein
MTFGTISHGHGALTPADTRFVCSLYWGMRLTKAQLMLLSQYFSDVSKILFGSTVIGYAMSAHLLHGFERVNLQN